MAALWKVRHLCTRAEHVRMTVPGSHVLVQAIMSAIDDYAERETGDREYFWNKPYGAG
jgi:phage-related protein